MKETLKRLWTGAAVLLVAGVLTGAQVLVWSNPFDWLPMWANWIWRGIFTLALVYGIGMYLATPAYPPLPDSLEDEDGKDNPTWNF